MTTFNVTINGREYGPTEVRDELTMNDYLREYLGLTGTKFGCGAAQCLSCAVIVDSPDGTSYTSPTCIVPAVPGCCLAGIIGGFPIPGSAAICGTKRCLHGIA